jgi:hypothetical protein
MRDPGETPGMKLGVNLDTQAAFGLWCPSKTSITAPVFAAPPCDAAGGQFSGGTKPAIRSSICPRSSLSRAQCRKWAHCAGCGASATGLPRDSQRPALPRTHGRAVHLTWPESAGGATAWACVFRSGAVSQAHGLVSRASGATARRVAARPVCHADETRHQSHQHTCGCGC